MKKKFRDQTTNEEGSNLISKSIMLGTRILNGNIVGDETGKYTHIGLNSKSVIEDCLVNELGWDKMKRMEIKENLESDQLPMIITTEDKMAMTPCKEQMTIKRVTDWSQKGTERYKERLKKTDWKTLTNLEDFQKEIKKAIN